MAFVRHFGVFLLCAVAFCKQRLIITDDQPTPTWMSDEQVEQLEPGFMDITMWPTVPEMPEVVRNYPDRATRQSVVNPILQRIDMGRSRTFLANFTNFRNRYYTTYGVQSANFLYTQVQALIPSGRSDVTVQRFTHSNWPQDSIVARIEGTQTTNDVIILGAHEDSVNNRGGSRPQDRAPGADDDGSGSATVLEAFRVMVASGFRPQRPIEFQWYAAEEVGLLGSQDMANTYSRQGRRVHAMTQYDMVAYATTTANQRIDVSQSVAVIPSLSKFLEVIIDEYCFGVTRRAISGTTSSDHASWFRAGYPTCRGRESQSYPYIHTQNDNVQYMNFNFMQQFVRYGVGYAVELSYV